jgi:hypothetical protein
MLRGTSRLWWLTVIVGCGGSPAPPIEPVRESVTTTAPLGELPDAMMEVAAPIDVAPPAPTIPERASLGDVPAHEATGGFRSGPRGSWPCAIRERWPDGETRSLARFEYAGPARCELP